jgi:hypothetical protein
MEEVGWNNIGWKEEFLQMEDGMSILGWVNLEQCLLGFVW